MTDREMLLELSREVKRVVDDQFGGEAGLAREMVKLIVEAGEKSPITLQQLCVQVATSSNAPHIREAIIDAGYGDQVDEWLGPEYARCQILDLMAEVRGGG